MRIKREGWSEATCCNNVDIDPADREITLLLFGAVHYRNIVANARVVT